MRSYLWYSEKCTSEPGSENETHLLSDFIKQLNETGNIEHVEKFVRLSRNLVVAKKGFIELSCLSDLFNASLAIITKSNLDLFERSQ